MDRTVIQPHEIPFYEALQSTTNEVLEKISEGYTHKEFRKYWAKISKQKSSSPSDRYMGLYNVLATAVTNPEIRDKQQALM